MACVDGFTVSEVSGLRSPVVIMAFTGWSDTGTVSTDAAERLVSNYKAERFLEVDPEDYYVFTDTRPHVRIDEDGVRALDWPDNEGFAARLPDNDHDLVIVTYWRSFEQHERSHADSVFKARFSALAAMCTDTREFGYDMLWQGAPERAHTGAGAVTA